MFQKAARTQAFIKIAIAGPSGSGKTYSALALATGLANGGKIALIDSENGSASLYADTFLFDTATLTDYSPEKFIETMKAAVATGYSVLVLDSITHEWEFLKTQKDLLDAKGGNSYTNWGKISPRHDAFVEAIKNLPIHIICTMRSKQEYVLQENARGKQEPKKVGMAPVQRDGMEYEYSIMFDVGMSHDASTSKDRTGLFDNWIGKLSKDEGNKILTWINSASAAPAPVPTPAAVPVVPTRKPMTDQVYEVILGQIKTGKHDKISSNITEDRKAIIGTGGNEWEYTTEQGLAIMTAIDNARAAAKEAASV